MYIDFEPALRKWMAKHKPKSASQRDKDEDDYAPKVSEYFSNFMPTFANQGIADYVADADTDESYDVVFIDEPYGKLSADADWDCLLSDRELDMWARRLRGGLLAPMGSVFHWTTSERLNHVASIYVKAGLQVYPEWIWVKTTHKKQPDKVHGPSYHSREYFLQVVHQKGKNSFFEHTCEKLPSPSKLFGSGILLFTPTRVGKDTNVAAKPVQLLCHLIHWCVARVLVSAWFLFLRA